MGDLLKQEGSLTTDAGPYSVTFAGVPQALKTLTAAESETGITPSTIRAALVSVGIVGKAEATAFTVTANGVSVAEYKGTPLAADVVTIGTFLVQPGKTIKLVKVTGAISNGTFSVQLLGSGG